MEPSKSQFDIYVDLCSHLISQNPLFVGKSKSIQRDIETLQYRYAHEGLSFLTKTMPLLGKALDEGLITSRFTTPREFKRSAKGVNRPAFLQAYFNLVFDDTGRLLDDAEPAAVLHLRQVLYFGYKLEVPYQESQEARVIESFVGTELELEVAKDVESAAIIAAAGYILRGIFEDFDPSDIRPRHGPGAVATGERLDEKWVFARLYSDIHQVYPYYEYFMTRNRDELMDRLEWYKSLDRRDYGVAKVVLVPKDSRGPRLISCEPLEYQWIQQGLGRKIMSHLESSRITKGNINFTHQQINRDLAQSASTDGAYATLDLKDASDRVSLELVEELFKHNEKLLKCLKGTRTRATELPDGRIITLKKFAPMGSALCFPVEAVVFWALIVATISRATRQQPKLVGSRVFVYGDDIIVPTEHASLVMQTLPRFGLRFNPRKCCITGQFRESCGMDAFKGMCVTPARLRTLWTGRATDGAALASYTSLANQLGEKGYKEAQRFLQKKVESVYGVIPYGTQDSGFPCWNVPTPLMASILNRGRRVRMRWNRDLQRIEFLVKRLSPRRQATKLDGWQRLLRGIVTSFRDVDPSETVFPRSVKIKRGWSAI